MYYRVWKCLVLQTLLIDWRLFIVLVLIMLHELAIHLNEVLVLFILTIKKPENFSLLLI